MSKHNKVKRLLLLKKKKRRKKEEEELVSFEFLLHYYSACHPRMDYADVIICSCIFKGDTEGCYWRCTGWIHTFGPHKTRIDIQFISCHSVICIQGQGCHIVLSIYDNWVISSGVGCNNGVVCGIILARDYQGSVFRSLGFAGVSSVSLGIK